MKFEKIIALAVVIASISVLFCGCGKGYLDNYIYFNIDSKPTSLDPQIAVSDEELLIVRNIFEGLMRRNEKGEIVCGAAESYTVSGLNYTFTLRKDAVWSDGTPLTAKDFEFGLKRAVSPEVKAPFVNRLLCIKNAESIANGSADLSTLGVEATSDTTLKITLESADESFLYTLATSVAMPCNEAFFKSTIGKYGLDAESVLSNGSYYLKKWNPDDFGIRLYRNDLYNGDFAAMNGAVFISNKDDEKPKEFFEKKSVDCAFVKNSEIDGVMQLGLTRQSYRNTVWFMTVSPEFDEGTRESFVEAFSPDIYSDKLPSGLTAATSIYPPTLSDSEKRDSTYNLKSAMSRFSEIIKNLPDKRFPASTLVCYDNESILPAARAILGHWQKNLSAYINISSAKHPEELKTQLTEKTVDFALFPITAKSDRLDEYLANFGINNTDKALAQQELLSDNTLLPIAYEDTNICYLSDIKNLYTDSQNGYIDFSFSVKKD